MNLYSHRQAIIEQLTEALPDGFPQEVRGHRGQFNSLKEIQKIAVRKTTALVACRGFTNANADYGETVATVQWVIFVLTQEGRQPRDELAGAIVNNVLKLLPNNDWGVAKSNPEKINGRNITSGDIDKAGMALWAITWQQDMPIDSQLSMADLDDFLLAHGDKDLDADAPEASDEITLPQ